MTDNQAGDGPMDWRIRAAKIRSKLESMNVSSGERKPTMAEQIRAEREARGDDMDPLERIRSLRSSAMRDATAAKAAGSGGGGGGSPLVPPVSPLRETPAGRRFPPHAADQEAKAAEDTEDGAAGHAAPSSTTVEELRAKAHSIRAQMASINGANSSSHAGDMDRGRVAKGSPVQTAEEATGSRSGSRSSGATDSLGSNRRSDIADLMKTLRETRRQADQATNQLARQRDKAAAQKRMAAEAREQFIKEQEARDSASLRAQQQLEIGGSSSSSRSNRSSGNGGNGNDEDDDLGGGWVPDGEGSDGEYEHVSSRARAGRRLRRGSEERQEEEEKKDGVLEEDGSSSGQFGASQLHGGMIVLQGPRDLLNLRQNPANSSSSSSSSNSSSNSSSSSSSSLTKSLKPALKQSSSSSSSSSQGGGASASSSSSAAASKQQLRGVTWSSEPDRVRHIRSTDAPIKTAVSSPDFKASSPTSSSSSSSSSSSFVGEEEDEFAASSIFAPGGGGGVHQQRPHEWQQPQPQPVFSMHHRRPDPLPPGAGDASPELARRRVAEIHRMQQQTDRDELMDRYFQRDPAMAAAADRSGVGADEGEVAANGAGRGGGSAGRGAFLGGSLPAYGDVAAVEAVLDSSLLDMALEDEEDEEAKANDAGGDRTSNEDADDDREMMGAAAIMREEAAESALDELILDLADFEVNKEGTDTLDLDPERDAEALKEEVARQFAREKSRAGSAHGRGGGRPRMVGRDNSPQGLGGRYDRRRAPPSSTTSTSTSNAAGGGGSKGGDPKPKESLAFRCDVCGRTFKKATHLRVHSNVHARERAQPKEEPGGLSSGGIGSGGGGKGKDLRRDEEYKKEVDEEEEEEGGRGHRGGPGRGGGALLRGRGRLLTYLHDGGKGAKTEAVRLVEEHSAEEGGGVTVFIPSLGRERQTVWGRLLDDGGAEAEAAAAAAKSSSSKATAASLSSSSSSLPAVVSSKASAATEISSAPLRRRGGEGGEAPTAAAAASEAMDGVSDEALFSIGRAGGVRRRVTSPESKQQQQQHAAMVVDYAEDAKDISEGRDRGNTDGAGSGGIGTSNNNSNGGGVGDQVEGEFVEVVSDHKAHMALADQINADAKENGPDMEAMHRLWDMMQAGMANAEQEKAALFTNLEKTRQAEALNAQPLPRRPLGSSSGGGGGGAAAGGGGGRDATSVPSATNQVLPGGKAAAASAAARAEEGIMTEVMGAMGMGAMVKGMHAPSSTSQQKDPALAADFGGGNGLPGGMENPANAAAQQRLNAAVVQRRAAEKEAEDAAAAAARARAERAALEEQSAKMAAMMEAMGAAGNRDLMTLSAHAAPPRRSSAASASASASASGASAASASAASAPNAGSNSGYAALASAEPKAVAHLLSDMAMHKLDDGELSMAEAGAALSAVFRRTGGVSLSSGGALDVSSANHAADAQMMRLGADLAAGELRSSSSSSQQQMQQQQMQQQQMQQQQQQRSRGQVLGGALVEAQAQFPELWNKWLQKLRSKGYLKGMVEGSADHELHLEKAAAKFLQSKAIAKLRGGGV